MPPVRATEGFVCFQRATRSYTKEEMKVVWETRKIFECKGMDVSCTAVRVPTLRAHAEAITLETFVDVSPAEARCVCVCVWHCVCICVHAGALGGPARRATLLGARDRSVRVSPHAPSDLPTYPTSTTGSSWRMPRAWCWRMTWARTVTPCP
jgi:aspartate-semialdehyde dehydrogenase